MSANMLVILIISYICSLSTASSVNSEDIRFVRNNRRVLDQYFVTNGVELTTISCKKTNTSGSGLVLEVLYSSKPSKSYNKTAPNKIQFTTPLDLVLSCSMNINHKNVSKILIVKGSQSEAVVDSSTAISDRRLMRHKLEAPWHALFSSQEFDASCATKFQLPEKQYVRIETSLKVISSKLTYKIIGYTVLVNLTQTLQSSELSEQASVMCIVSDAVFPEIHVKAIRELRFHRMRSVEIFSNCRGNEHICLVNKTSDVPDAEIEWKVNRTNGAVELYAGSQLELKGTTYKKMCCYAKSRVPSVNVSFKKEVCRSIVRTCFSRRHNFTIITIRHPSGGQYYYKFGKSYFVSRTKASWHSAMDFCRTLWNGKGRLVRIDSEIENKFLASRISMISWIGTTTGIKLKWDDGCPLLYTNLVGTSPRWTKRCGQLRTTNQWNYVNCSVGKRFICQKRSPCPKDPVCATLYKHRYMRGRTLKVGRLKPDFGNFDNMLTDYSVKNGCSLTLYEQVNYGGRRLEVTGSGTVPLNTWNDKASSSKCRC